MEAVWKSAWQGMITGGDAWEATVSPGDEGWTWDTECFHRFGSGRAPTEAEAKAAALTWIADTLRRVPARAAWALAEIGEKPPTSPASASESATLPETPPVATERPVGLVWRETAWGYRAKAEVWTLNLVKASGAWEWHTEFYLPHPWPVCEVGQGTAPTLDAAKAAAEACLRAWVARLNASLGGA